MGQNVQPISPRACISNSPKLYQPEFRRHRPGRGCTQGELLRGTSLHHGGDRQELYSPLFASLKSCINIRPNLGRPVSRLSHPRKMAFAGSMWKGHGIGEPGSFDLSLFFTTLYDTAFHLMAQSSFLQLSNIKTQTPRRIYLARIHVQAV